MTRALRRREIRLHGHPVSYYEAGSGPVVLLVHGITASADAWRSVLPALAEHHTWSRRTGRQRDVRGAALGLASLHDGEARRAFLHTARSIIDPSGQRVSARDRLYLAEGMPTLILWGDRDPMIPAAHGIAAHEAIPHSRLELFPGAATTRSRKTRSASWRCCENSSA